MDAFCFRDDGGNVDGSNFVPDDDAYEAREIDLNEPTSRTNFEILFEMPFTGYQGAGIYLYMTISEYQTCTRSSEL